MPIDEKPEWPLDLKKKTTKLPPLGQAYTPGEQYIINQNHEAGEDRNKLYDAFNALLHICRLDHGHLVNAITDVDKLKTIDKLRAVAKHDAALVDEGKWYFPTKLVEIIKMVGKWTGILSKFVGSALLLWEFLKHVLGIHLP